MGPRQGRKERGRVGASFQHSSQKGRDVFKQCVCNNWNKAGGSQVSEQRSESWCFVVHHGHLLSRCPISPHCLHFCPFSCLFTDGAKWVLPINPPQLLCSQNSLTESCIRDGEGDSQHFRYIQDAPPPPLKAGPGPILLLGFPSAFVGLRS